MWSCSLLSYLERYRKMTKEKSREWYQVVPFEPFFSYSHALNRKKPVSAFRAKKGGICFEVAYATKKLGPRISITLLFMRLRELRVLTGTKFTYGWGFPCPAFLWCLSAGVSAVWSAGTGGRPTPGRCAQSPASPQNAESILHCKKSLTISPSPAG